MNKKQVRRFLQIFFSCVCTVIIVFPIYWVVLTSVRPIEEILANPPHFLPNLATATLKHYQLVLGGRIGSSTNSYGLPTFFLNSIIVSTCTTLVTMVLGLLAGYSLVRYPFKGSRLISQLILLCYLIPTIALLIPMFTMAVDLHLNNSLYGLILFQVAVNLPLAIWFTKAFIKGLPVSVEESAKLDGCGRFQVITRIVAPLSVPGLVVVGFNTFLSSWNDYVLPSVLIDVEGLKPLMVGLFLYFNQNIGVVWGEMMAAAFCGMVPIFFVFFYFQKYIVGGLSAGAVKG